jgi:gamma-glutamyltranspeptidase
MGVEVAEERVLQFIVQEIHAGKSLDEALKEPYVENNTTPEWRREILERPEIIQAVEEEMEKAFGSPPGGQGSD